MANTVNDAPSAARNVLCEGTPIPWRENMERVKVGEVFHFYGKIGVAAIRLTDGELAVGDTIQIQGPSTNLTQVVDAMQIEHADVPRATKGQEVGVKVRDRAREKDLVYKVLAA